MQETMRYVKHQPKIALLKKVLRSLKPFRILTTDLLSLLLPPLPCPSPPPPFLPYTSLTSKGPGATIHFSIKVVWFIYSFIFFLTVYWGQYFAFSARVSTQSFQKPQSLSFPRKFVLILRLLNSDLDIEICQADRVLTCLFEKSIFLLSLPSS